LGRQLGIEDPEQWLELCPKRVFENWQAAYEVEPFGNEQELLARAVSLLYLIATENREFEKVCKASDSLMAFLMPSGWQCRKTTDGRSVTNVEEIKQNLKAMQDVAAKVFG